MTMRLLLAIDHHESGRAAVDEASKRGCHAIVLGSLRRRGLPSALVHRMRARIIRLSPLPVVITPPARSAVASTVGA
jgi:nucleotide-binding universal stress UspA family protein